MPTRNTTRIVMSTAVPKAGWILSASSTSWKCLVQDDDGEPEGRHDREGDQ